MLLLRFYIRPCYESIVLHSLCTTNWSVINIYMETEYINNLGVKTEVPRIKVLYVLYARKSTESDEKQALSIESQVKEMLSIADRDGLEVVDIRRESHSAKESRQRT